MGAVSTQPKTDLKLKKDVDEKYLNPRNLLIFFDQYTRKQMKPYKSDATVETAIFPIIIEQIFLYQNNPGQFIPPANLETRIYDAIYAQITPFILQAMPFADRFRYIEDTMENHIQSEIIKMEMEWHHNNSSFMFEMGSSAQTPTILQAAFNVFFQVSNSINCLSVEQVDNLFKGLLDLVTSPDCPDLSGTSTQLISQFNEFVVKLALSPKFATNQIKSKIITFLLHISTIQGGISTVLAALTVGMTVPSQTPFEGNSIPNINPTINIDSVEFGILSGAEKPIELCDTIYSAAATIYALYIVTKSHGIVEVDHKGAIRYIDITDPENTLITTSNSNYLITFNVKTNLMKIISIADSTVQVERELNDIPENSKIIGIAFCKFLFIMVETSMFEYDFYSYSIDVKLICFYSKTPLKTSASAKFLLPYEKSLAIFTTNNDPMIRLKIHMKEKKFKLIQYVSNRMQYKEGEIAASCSNTTYIISSNSGKIKIRTYPALYGDILPFPDFAHPVSKPTSNFTFNNFIVSTISDMTIQLYQTVKQIFPKPKQTNNQQLQFFAASPKDTIKFALSLGNQSLNSDLAPVSTRQRILFFSTMLLTVNGMCFISQFPLDQFELDPSDIQLLKDIRVFIETTAFHHLTTTEIVAAAFQTIRVCFRFLYYPNYGQFRSFLNGFKTKPYLLASVLPFLRSSPALFYSIDSEILQTITRFLSPHNICYLIDGRIRYINSELHFLKTHNISAHEQYIANFVSATLDYFTDNICYMELFSHDQYTVDMILRTFTRVLVLDSAPIVSVAFAKSCLKLLEAIRSKLSISCAMRSSDLEYSSVPDADETTQKKVVTIETPHNYEDGHDLEWKVEMNGASEIEIEFHQKCATERNTDYLQIYDRAEGGSLVGKNLSGPPGLSNWPRKMTIQSDSCRFYFHADETTNDWGIQCTISANVPVATRQFKPQIDLMMINLICYAIGRSLQQALISLPIIEHEREYKLLLESDLLQFSSSVFHDQSLLQAQLQIQNFIKDYVTEPLPPPTIQIRPNRSKSERAFDEMIQSQQAITAHPSTDEMRLDLISELTADILQDGTPASLLLHTLYKSVHNQRIKQLPLTNIVERFALAAFIRHLGLIPISTMTAMALVQSTANPTGPAKPPLAHPFTKLVAAIYRIRRTFYLSYQKSKDANHSATSLRENYVAFVREALMKTHVLLLTEPLFKGKEAFDDALLDKALDSLVTFLTSDVTFEDLEKMVSIRVKRAKTRIKAMDIVKQFLELPELYYTACISFLSPLLNSFTAVVDKSSITTISSKLNDLYDQKISDIHKLFIHYICLPNIPNALRLFLLRILLFPTTQVTDGQQNIKSVLTFISSFQPKSIDEIAFSEGIWLFATNIAIQNRTPQLCDFLTKLLTEFDNDSLRYRIVSFQNLMVLDSYYKDYDLQFFFDLMEKSTPRLIACLYQFIASYFTVFGISDDFSVVFCKEKLNFRQLMKKFLSYISLAQIYEKIPFLDPNLPFPCHQYIANSMVSFFRQLLQTSSKVHEHVKSLFSEILDEISSISDIEKFLSNRSQSLDFLSILIIFGHGSQPFLQSGYGIITNGPNKDELIRITSFSPLSSQITGHTLSKSFVSCTVDQNAVSATSKVAPNSRVFQFTEENFRLFHRFHNFCLDSLSNNRIYANHSLLYSLISSFYCFIPLAIQEANAMKMFINSGSIKSWINFANEKTEESKLNSISELMADIGFLIETHSQNEEDKKFTKKKNAKNFLPFSILPSFERPFSPFRMVTLYGSGIEKDFTIISSSFGCFVGDRSVPSQSQFYWEVKITSSNANPRFQLGFIDSRFPDKPSDQFALIVHSKEIISPTNGTVKIDEQFAVQSGDIFGVALAQQHIFFFRNGIKISRSILTPHLGDFTPFILCQTQDVMFEYNFGHYQFKIEFTREAIFDFCGECFIEIDTPIPTNNHKFADNSVESPSYKKDITQSKPVMEYPRTSYETNYPKRTAFSQVKTETPLAYIMKPAQPTSYIKVAPGMPLLVSRIHLTPKEVTPNERIFFSTSMKEKLGKIGIVKEIIPKETNFNAVLEFCEPEYGVIEPLKFDSRFLSYLPIHRYVGTSFSHQSLINTNYMHHRIAFLSTQQIPVITELNCLARALSIRMCRYSMLILLDYLRTTSQAFALFEDEQLVNLLSILILELTNFSPSISIKSKWAQIRSSDSVFTIASTHPILVVDPSKMLRILRAVLYSIYQNQEQSRIFSSLFQIALKTLCSDADSPDTLFTMSPAHLQFESTHPCTKLQINYTVTEPNAFGFVPVIATNCQIPEPGITAANIKITSRQSEIRLIDGNSFSITGDFTQTNGFPGLTVAFIPIKRRLCDSSLVTPEGAVHLTFSLLSLIFSFSTACQSDKVCLYMKTNLLPAFLGILKDGGVFGSVFAFEFIAPLLSHLEWRSGDLTSSTLALIKEYLKKYEDSVTEWTKLGVAAQHATLLKMLFDLTVIDATTRNITKPPPIESFEISENSIESSKHIHRLSFFYETLNEKLHQKPSCVFDEVTNAFTRVAALAHNWSFPIKFPSFLLLDSFLSSVQYDPITIDSYDQFTINGDIATRIICVPHANMLLLELENIYFVTIIDKKNPRNVFRALHGAQTKLSTNSILIQLPCNIKTPFSIKIKVSELSDVGRENLFISHIDLFSRNCQFMEKKWNHKIDETLLKIMNQNPQLSVDKSRFKLSQTQFASNSVLQDVPPSLLAARVELIRQLNSSVTQLLKCVDLGDSQVLSAAVIAAKSAVATSYKLDLFRKRVMTRLDEDPRLNLRFNRSRAALHMMNPTHPDASPLLKQLIDQVPIRSLNALKRDSVPWHVDLLGEGATDAGGPARDLFTQMCMEIMHPSTGLFVMTPNKRDAGGPNQELLIPNSHSTSQQMQQMFIYGGVLMTIAYISRLPQPFKFVEFVWAHFTGAQMTIEDIYAIDHGFETLMKRIEASEIDDAEAERLGLTFTVKDTHGDNVELFPGGSGVRVTQERLTEYAAMCKKFRLREMKLQLDWMKEGISYFFPPDALFLLSPWELELIVCGDNTIPIAELKKHCRFDANDRSSKMLWQVLETFSPEERMLFIKFATGRMGLPPPGSKWHSDLTITWVQSNVKDDAMMPLPTAATCSSTIRIPRYSTEEWMGKKIRAAIVFGVDIDTDRQVNFADIVQLS